MLSVLVGLQERSFGTVTASRKVLRSAQACNELCGGYAFKFEASSERLH